MISIYPLILLSGLDFFIQDLTDRWRFDLAAFLSLEAIDLETRVAGEFKADEIAKPSVLRGRLRRPFTPLSITNRRRSIIQVPSSLSTNWVIYQSPRFSSEMLPSKLAPSQAEQGSPEMAARASLIMNGISASAATLSSHHQPRIRVAASPTIKTIARYPQTIDSTASARSAREFNRAATLNLYPARIGIPILATTPTRIPQALSCVSVIRLATNNP
jgi:hypothetical protein